MRAVAVCGAGADFCGIRTAACRRRELEPLVGDDHHGLRQVERGEGGIDRQGEDAVGQRDLVIFKSIALAAEHDRDCFAGSDPRRHQRGSLLRPDHRFRLVVGAGGRGQDEAAVGDGGCERVVELAPSRMRIGAGRQHARLVVGPAVAAA